MSGGVLRNYCGRVLKSFFIPLGVVVASEAVMLAPSKNLLDGPVFGFSNLLVEGDLTIAILECQKRSKVNGNMMGGFAKLLI